VLSRRPRRTRLLELVLERAAAPRRGQTRGKSSLVGSRPLRKAVPCGKPSAGTRQRGFRSPRADSRATSITKGSRRAKRRLPGGSVSLSQLGQTAVGRANTPQIGRTSLLDDVSDGCFGCVPCPVTALPVASACGVCPWRRRVRVAVFVSPCSCRRVCVVVLVMTPCLQGYARGIATLAGLLRLQDCYDCGIATLLRLLRLWDCCPVV
jgi:hypothetical protein